MTISVHIFLLMDVLYRSLTVLLLCYTGLSLCCFCQPVLLPLIARITEVVPPIGWHGSQCGNEHMGLQLSMSVDALWPGPGSCALRHTECTLHSGAWSALCTRKAVVLSGTWSALRTRRHMQCTLHSEAHAVHFALEGTACSQSALCILAVSDGERIVKN